jgi:hypothetical protein
MDTNQLMAGLAAAVNAAKPAPEYCFLWIESWATCMTRSEWSGWMQFFGAFGALVVALWLPYLQARIGRANHFSLAVACLSHQLSVFDEIELFASRKGDTRQALSHCRESIDSLTALYQEVRASELPSDALAPWRAARANIAKLRRLEDSMGPDQGARKVLARYRITVEMLQTELVKHDPRLRISLKRFFQRRS